MSSKKGFTLAEIIISMGIIAVMATLMATAFTNAKPDKTKILYLKCYDALTTAVNRMASDSTIFNPVYETGRKTYNIEGYPFLDTAKPINSLYNGISGISGKFKFAKILSSILNGKNNSQIGTVYLFTTDTNDTLWEIKPIGTPISAGDSTVNFANKITLRLNNAEFRFCMQADGGVQIGDTVGQNYIDNRTNVRRRNNSQQTQEFSECTANTYNITQISGNDYLVTD